VGQEAAKVLAFEAMTLLETLEGRAQFLMHQDGQLRPQHDAKMSQPMMRSVLRQPCSPAATMRAGRALARCGDAA
jgi:hypothetical protein